VDVFGTQYIHRINIELAFKNSNDTCRASRGFCATCECTISSHMRLKTFSDYSQSFYA